MRKQRPKSRGKDVTFMSRLLSSMRAAVKMSVLSGALSAVTLDLALLDRPTGVRQGGIMLQLWLREVLLFLDVVSFNTCNRNEKMQRVRRKGGGECRLGFVVACARTGLVRERHTGQSRIQNRCATFRLERRQNAMKKIRMRLTVRQKANQRSKSTRTSKSEGANCGRQRYK